MDRNEFLEIFRSGLHLASKIQWWAILLPGLTFFVIVLASYSSYGWVLSKPVQEIVAPVVIGLATVLVIMIWLFSRKFAVLPLLALVVALFARELHFYGTNLGFYVAFVVIVIWVAKERARLEIYGQGDFVTGLAASAMLTYALTKILDRGYLGFLPDHGHWRHHAEESLETFGHLLILALVIAVFRVTGRSSVS